ncbi:DUF3383 family protein [uncultured Oscillibacter sp.]|uniref:DUF3383 family protein n=1 Tax=uncultured Oscillibacter sp. TaxID=876091 RepID=UPI00272BB0D2|nr:DUF3383 family protein [uncultured Oscillibacter sp.]
MSSNLERICIVDIAIASPISNDANFDNCLIIGPAPAAPKGDIPKVGVFNALEELTELGFVAVGANADPIGVAARVAFSQSPRPHEVYVTCVPAAAPVVAAEGEEEAGTEPVVPAAVSVADVLTEALDTNGWYCICPVGLTKEQVKEVIEWTETQNKLCGYIDDDPDNPIVQAGIYMRSYPVYPKVTPDQADADVPLENKYGMAIAMAAKAMNYHAGSETWALKPLAAVTPSKLNSTAIKKMQAANFNYVLTVASKNITQGGKTNSGEWIDIVRFRDWLQNDMQVRVVNLLVTYKGKVPYTDGGIALVQNQMISSLKDGQRYGGISPTEYDEDGNEIPGFVTHVPLAANIPATKKASRVLEDVSFEARLAGAIHMVTIKGTLTYDNL